MIEPFLRKLSARSPLDPSDLARLSALIAGDVRAGPRDFLVQEGEPVNRTLLVLDGYAARFKMLPDGGRQIVSLQVAGDLVDLHSAITRTADYNVAALGPARLAYLPHDALLAAMDASPTIARALWYDMIVDASNSREWLLNVGRRDAYTRMAHLFCELAIRLDVVGLYQDGRFHLPLTQGELADTTGLTPVHVNRTLQRLRAGGLISTRGAELRIEDWDRLVAAGGFDLTYLYLRR